MFEDANEASLSSHSYAEGLNLSFERTHLHHWLVYQRYAAASFPYEKNDFETHIKRYY